MIRSYRSSQLPFFARKVRGQHQLSHFKNASGSLIMNHTAALLRTSAQPPWTGMVTNSTLDLNDQALSRTSEQHPWTGMVTNSTLDLNYHAFSSLDGQKTEEPYAATTSDYSDYYSFGIDPSAYSCVYGDHASTFLPVLYFLFFVVGFLGNILVVWVVLMGVKLRSMTDICLLNLAIADLLLVSSLPFLAHSARDQWIFGDGMCIMVLSVYHIGFYSGIFFIVLMSVDRYLAVVHAVFALRVRTRTYGILASVVIWIVAVCASFPELKFLKTTNNNNHTYCTSYPTTENISNRSYRIIGIFKMNVMGLILPLIVIGFCYSLILKRLLTIRSSRRQAMRLVIVVMVVFFCCWAPYNIAAFVKALELKELILLSCPKSKAIRLSLQITEVLAYSHSCINPMLYVFVGEKFRRHLLRLLYKTPFNRLQFMKSYIMQATGSVYSQTTSVDERSTAV
ncbi:C-C chemokine receptor type 5 isoform X1 [Pimephales promelas]|uniref:C-C chemokine receptor type 5 isoform X1 n=2 Tax=Pimephales promelas TaxID=90988 RepID=UPI0019558BEF|nr:C-C chemokine receptor type 5 isoform X1 [Pimephales promelas]